MKHAQRLARLEAQLVRDDRAETQWTAAECDLVARFIPCLKDRGILTPFSKWTRQGA